MVYSLDLANITGLPLSDSDDDLPIFRMVLFSDPCYGKARFVPSHVGLVSSSYAGKDDSPIQCISIFI